MTTWDHSFDFVIVGSGGGGLVAALAAQDVGLKPVVLEKQSLVGGSTAMSGGVLWMPNNPLMRAEGVADSHRAGLDYLEAVVGDAGPASSPARRESFLTEGSAMISMLQRKGVRLVRCPGYSDYYDNRKGGHAAGRSIEGVPYDARSLGEWQDKLIPGLTRAIGLAVKTNELRRLATWNRTPGNAMVAAKVYLRTLVAKILGQDLVTSGMSLIGQILEVAVGSGIPVWTGCPVDDLVVEDGKVVGVRATRDGLPISVEASHGVLLAAAGFERNAEMRRKYSGDQPNEAEWTTGNRGNTGEVLAAAIGLGAKVDFMDEAWWNPAPRAELHGSSLGVARYLPGTILVDGNGERFVNEANSYVEVCKAMYARRAVPCWLIFDDGYRRRYPATSRVGLKIWRAVPGRYPKEWMTNGWIRKADTIDRLAYLVGLDGQALAETLRRFNVDAARGQDSQFGRGESGYNRTHGDAGFEPNASVGPLETPPFYATEIYPGDVGTCGGLVTDEFAQVLDGKMAVIPGLYATGNITATVLGRTYPGAGASIANTMAFGYAAARHAGVQAAGGPA